MIITHSYRKVQSVPAFVSHCNS